MQLPSALVWSLLLAGTDAKLRALRRDSGVCSMEIVATVTKTYTITTSEEVVLPCNTGSSGSESVHTDNVPSPHTTASSSSSSPESPDYSSSSSKGTEETIDSKLPFESLIPSDYFPDVTFTEPAVPITTLSSPPSAGQSSVPALGSDQSSATTVTTSITPVEPSGPGYVHPSSSAGTDTTDSTTLSESQTTVSSVTGETSTETCTETSTEVSLQTTVGASTEISTESCTETSTEVSAQTTVEASSSTETCTETSTEVSAQTTVGASTETSPESCSETSAEVSTETSAEAPTSTESCEETTTEVSAQTTVGASTSCEETTTEVTTETTAEATASTGSCEESTTEVSARTTAEASTSCEETSTEASTSCEETTTEVSAQTTAETSTSCEETTTAASTETSSEASTSTETCEETTTEATAQTTSAVSTSTETCEETTTELPTEISTDTCTDSSTQIPRETSTDDCEETTSAAITTSTVAAQTTASVQSTTSVQEPEPSSYTRNYPADVVDKLQDSSMDKLKAYLKRNASPGCTLENAAVRREWGDLSVAERRQYTAAVQCLMNKPAKTPSNIAAGAKSRYDDFVVTHIQQTNTIHNTASFLSWHRYFTWAYETALRDECGYTGYQPYWNWARYANDPVNSPIFNGDAGSLGGNSNGGGCADPGPFDKLTVNLGPGNSLRYNPRCVKRDVSRSFAQQCTADKTMAVLNEGDIGRFQDHMQVYNGIHAGGHFTIGGDPGSDVFTSPGDPAFFVHHAMIDRVWWIWQLQDLDTRLSAVAGRVGGGSNRQGSLQDAVTLGFVGGSTVLGDLLNTMGGKGGDFCYIYV